MIERILVIDDDEAIRDGCKQVLSRDGYDVQEASNAHDALNLLDRYDFDLLLLDLKMPDTNGLDLLRKIRQRDISVPVVMITAYGTMQNAVQAMRLGANDFLSKPFEPEELRLIVSRTLRDKRLTLENIFLKEELKRKEGDVKIVGNSKTMMSLLDRVARVAPTDSTVLITGESGTGKGLIARQIHSLSTRSEHPFVSVDCSTLVPSLFESELFGHVKGAFTGASVNKIGKFELASGGTLFLDEIANINLDLQAKLLKAVEEKVISRVGSHRLTKVDVRILAATNQDLRRSVEEGKFREDLFFRLNVVSIHTPPLRDHLDDLPLLIGHFLKKFGEKYRRPGLSLTKRAHEILRDYDWPGNVRELENAIERLVIFAQEQQIGEDDLQLAGLSAVSSRTRPKKSHRPQEVDKMASLEEVEKEHVLNILDHTGGNRTEAAHVLGIDRKTLRNKLKKWGID